MGPFKFLCFPLILAFSVNAQLTTYKICAYPDYSREICQVLEAGSRFACVSVTDSVECALSIINGTADFGEFHAEHAVLASKNEDASQTLQVLAQLRYSSLEREKYSIQTAVVVSSDYTGGLGGLRKLKYCQGFSSGTFSDRFANHFENKVVQMTCNDQVSAAEERISQIASFFGRSCRPGRWAEDFSLNSRLKQTYKSMCSLCPNKCDYDTKHASVQESTLDCLTRDGGDVAYVSLQSVKAYFGHQRPVNSSLYQFLCPDGSVRPINTNEPCAWATQPWDMILVNKNYTQDMNQSIFNALSPDSGYAEGEQWALEFKRRLLGRSKVAVAPESQDLRDNIKRVVDDDDLETSCRRRVKWCTIKLAEKEKCEWLSLAAKSYGMKPEIDCVSARNTTNCMSHIANNQADVMGIDTEYGHIAREVFNLSTVAFEDGVRKQAYKILAVIKVDDQNKYSSFQKIRKRNACFPEFRGLGWVAFVRAAKENSAFKSNECPMSFFNSACAPGATDSHHLLPGENPYSRLCMLCPASNSQDTATKNEYYGNVGAIKCLKSAGDVAFVDYSKLLDHSGRVYHSLNESSLMVLCRNGSLSNRAGLQVEDDCALAIGVSGEIVSGQNKTGVRQRDISELFLKMSDWFGNLGSSMDTPIRMFEAFKGETNLLFKEGTVGIVHNAEMYETVQSFVSLLESVNDDCRSSSSYAVPSLILILFMIVSRFF